MANYGTSAFASLRIGTALSGTFGSLELSRTITNGLPIVPNDYIGIYVDAGAALAVPPQVLIEGTLYFSLA